MGPQAHVQLGQRVKRLVTGLIISRIKKFVHCGKDKADFHNFIKILSITVTIHLQISDRLLSIYYLSWSFYLQVSLGLLHLENLRVFTAVYT